MEKGRLHHHSNVLSQWLQLHYQKRGYTSEENRPEEEDNHIVNPLYKHFLENNRPVAKKIDNGIKKSTGSVKYPNEQNYTEIEEEEEDDNSLIPDPEYKLFLEHLKPDGKSYALEIIEANVYVKYETPIENENLLSNAATVETEMHAPAKCNGKLHTDKSANGGCKHVASEAQNHAGNQVDKCRGREQKCQQLSADKNATVSNSSNRIGSGVQNRDLSCKGKRRGRKPKAGSELRDTKNDGDNSNHVVSEAHKHDRHRSNKVKKNVALSVHGRKIGEGVKMESDDDVQDIRRLVYCPVLNVTFLCKDNDEANARKCTKYREKLIEELKKPYCQEEYERLFKDITVRKHAQGQRVLRGNTKTYDEDRVSKSYLDCHIDLKRKINTNLEDYPKVLNLMRGFFYWLVNISHEGVFRPWRVQPYLDELLQH